MNRCSHLAAQLVHRGVGEDGEVASLGRVELRAEAFCEGMMSAEGAPRPLNSDMESAWKHSESRELLESFLAWLDAHICWAVRRPAGESKP